MAVEEKTKQRKKPCAFYSGFILIDETADRER